MSDICLDQAGDSVASLNGVEQRSIVDRRRARSAEINLRRLGFGGRRRTCRRENDQHHFCSDSYEPRFLLITVAIVVLSSLDATLTLILLKQGAMELNSIMATLIDTGEQEFINAKIALTAVSVVPLVAYKDHRMFNLFRVDSVLVMLLGGYAALVGYELALLSTY
ncbi:MAG: DUF5658 family protein [Gammaproteobacteria bacterium]|nr:DUF5658 family protein [Gammaproteobacteria bacterium]